MMTATKQPSVKTSTPAEEASVVKPEGKRLKAPAKAKPLKVEKLKKNKLIRDSFTMPKDEYDLINTLKARGVALKQPVKKSELLRAGIKLLGGLSDTAFLKAVRGVPSLKTGRPGKTPV